MSENNLKSLLESVIDEANAALSRLSDADGKEKFPYGIAKDIRKNMQTVKKLAQDIRTVAMAVFKSTR